MDKKFMSFMSSKKCVLRFFWIWSVPTIWAVPSTLVRFESRAKENNSEVEVDPSAAAETFSAQGLPSANSLRTVVEPVVEKEKPKKKRFFLKKKKGHTTLNPKTVVGLGFHQKTGPILNYQFPTGTDSPYVSSGSGVASTPWLDLHKKLNAYFPRETEKCVVLVTRQNLKFMDAIDECADRGGLPMHIRNQPEQDVTQALLKEAAEKSVLLPNILS